MENLRFTGSIRKSGTSNLWIGSCPALGICTQGTTRERAFEALAEAIAMNVMDGPVDSQGDDSVIEIPLSLIAEAANASYRASAA